MKSSILFSLLFALCLRLYPQVCDTVRVVGYYTTIRTIDSVGVIHISSGISNRTIELLSGKCNLKDSLISSFYTSHVFCDDPLLSIESAKSCFSSNEKYIENYSRLFDFVLTDMFRNSIVGKIVSQNYITYDFEIVKFEAVMWKMSLNQFVPNTIHSIKILTESHKNYYYCFNDLPIVRKFNEDEMTLLLSNRNLKITVRN